ncbi:hypothetical protein [Massilia sp. Leaf139]|uniref:hypothetical protein n=1 Tax=Massilia sp. Leaf139 TaxID=1736272 RepID=UPI0006FC12F8|nr:hypothetical protein [Massilia sp. Leaf139]KQQ88613.1 hypothetical protein ASF77_13290 [Massilia sp. Leaf139]
MKLKAPFYLWFVVAFLISYLVHESAHWLMGAAFGIDMEFRLNAVRYLSPMPDWQRALADAAGPLLTIAQGVIAYVLVERRASVKAFAFLYVAAFMRLAAAVVSVIHPNDEARLSLYLGLGKWTLPILVVLGLGALVWKASPRLQLTWKDQLLCYLVASLAVSAIVGADRFVL